MKEKPVIFNGPMVKAILNGKKTQFREPLKPQPTGLLEWFPKNKRKPTICASSDAGFALAMKEHGKYQIRDQLWVRETIYSGDLNPFGNFYYQADNKGVGNDIYFKLKKHFPEKESCGTIPSIHCPRYASRINLEIINVRVERIQQISKEDVEKEMVISGGSYRADFALSWAENFGASSWYRNDWVFVYEFKKI